MKLEEIREWDRTEYSETCPCCGSEQTILTQANDWAEYMTRVYLQCQCGEYLEFNLPVN